MKKAIVFTLVLSMLVFTVAGCGTSSGGTAPSQAPAAPAAPSSDAGSAQPESADPVALKFWYWADNAEQSAVMQEVVKGFNDSNGQNITVTAEEYPWDGGGFTDSVFTAAMGGGGPDVSMFKVAAGPLFSANNLLVDLNSYLGSWEDYGQIPDSIWNVMKQGSKNDGATRMMPFSVEALFFYYRPSYYEAAGVKVPTTYEELLTNIEKTTMDTDGDGKIDVYGFGMRGGSGGQEHLGIFMYPFGGTWEDMAAPGSVTGYQAYLDVFNKGYAPESSPNAAYAEMIDGFKSGLTTHIIHHIVSSTMWMETFGDDVDAFVVPAGSNGQWTCMGETELVMFEASQNKDAAFEFMKYMVTGQGGVDWFTKSGKGLPVTEGVQASAEYKNNRFMQYASDSLPIAGILPLTDTTTEFINSVYPATNQQALLGQVSAEEALQVMNKALNG